jgi:hypothetical protein
MKIVITDAEKINGKELLEKLGISAFEAMIMKIMR